MPVYEFRCDNCNAEWEDVLSREDRDATTHPKAEAECEEPQIRRLISSPRVRWSPGMAGGKWMNK